MSGLEVLVGIAGFSVTVLVVAAMILITPGGQVALPEQATDPRPHRDHDPDRRSASAAMTSSASVRSHGGDAVARPAAEPS